MQARIRHHHELRLERPPRAGPTAGHPPRGHVRPPPRPPPFPSPPPSPYTAGDTSPAADQPRKTPPTAPTVKTEPASAVSQTTATLNATVNPNGSEVSECKLEYGTTTSYGSSAPCAPAPGSGSSAVAVSAAISSLSANTTYHFRIVAKNVGGTSTGADETLKTLPNAPTVKTEPASAVSQTTATLNATVNPNGSEVSECKFEYGTSTSHRSSTPR